MKRTILLFVSLFLICGFLFSANSDFVVVIDAGHGGRDPGAVRGAIKEKAINLAVATELGRMIEKNMPDVKVVYTRKNDVFVDLHERSKVANRAKANLFMSIHVNSTAATTTRASGTETYILGLARSAENLAVAKRENAVIKYEEDYTTKYEGFDPDSPESYIIFEFMTNQYMQQSLDVASYIQKDFRNVAKRVDRGVRQAGLLVLRESSMPSILIELGYINNPTEAKYLASAIGQRTMASAIYSGFKKYKDDFGKRQGNGPIAKTPEKTTPKASANVSQSQSIAKAGEIEYRVQFLYSPVKIAEGSSQFKGIVPTGYTEDNGYKYTYGATTNYNEIMKMHGEVRKKFSDAFIVRVPAEGKSVAAAPSVKPIPVNKEPVVRNVVAQDNNKGSSIIPSGAIEYRIQFLYSRVKLRDNSPRFQGLEGVTFYVDNGYKYTVGSSTDKNEMERLLRDIKNKFSDAFVVEFKDGKRL